MSALLNSVPPSDPDGFVEAVIEYCTSQLAVQESSEVFTDGESGNMYKKNCGYCGAAAADGSQLKFCASCKSVGYCQKRCQKKHWSHGHRQVCRPING